MTDSYISDHGNDSFDVLHYDLDLEYAVDSNQLTGKARLEARALQHLDWIELDLHKLHVSKIRVNGAAVAKHSHRHDRLMIKLKEPLAEGQDFTVAVSYRGKPQPAPGIDGEAGWEELSDGALVASQPDGAPSWFPCNDRVSNKATYRIQVRAASEYVVVANGQLIERRRQASGTTWTYEQREPMATYLATVQIGRYVVRSATGSGSVLVQEIFPAAQSAAVKRTFRHQTEMIKLFGDLFGTYPYPAYAVIVTDDDLEIPIEAQGLSIFGANYLGTDWESERLVAHELAHQWFGNSLTLRHWRDIWLHEGFACYAEWLWSEGSGGRSAADHACEHWSVQSELGQDLILGDPGPELMFDDRVYKRGALLLHALRTTIGDDVFFELLRTWVSQHAHASVDTASFIELAEQSSRASLGGLFWSWLSEEALPALPPGTDRPEDE